MTGSFTSKSKVNELELTIQWAGSGSRGAADVANGGLFLRVGNEPIWGESRAEGVKWDWAALLEWLGRSWSFLTLEEGVPFGLAADRPSAMRALASERWQNTPLGERRDEENLFFEWMEVHDLARSIPGIDLPTVVSYREGRRQHVVTEYAKTELPSDEFRVVIERIGDEIARRLDQTSHPRGREAVSAWTCRGEPSS